MVLVKTVELVVFEFRSTIFFLSNNEKKRLLWLLQF